MRMNKNKLKVLEQSIREVCDEETKQKILDRQQILQKKYDEDIKYPIISFGNNEIVLSRFVLQKNIENLGFKRDKDKGYWHREYDSGIVRKIEVIFNIDLTGY